MVGSHFQIQLLQLHIITAIAAASSIRVPHLALLDFRVWRCLYSELEIDKSDWSLCNQAVQNSVINILPRVAPLQCSSTFNTVVKLIYYCYSDGWCVYQICVIL